jgi:hypothetical protein
MRRRDFLGLVGGAFATGPLSARAQQDGKLTTIGFLGSGTPPLEAKRTWRFMSTRPSDGGVDAAWHGSPSHLNEDT